MKQIGIFCSASEQIDARYQAAAQALGRWMGENGHTLVYGGSNQGLMECLAQAVKTHGGKVHGVLPAKMEAGGKASTYPDQLDFVETLSERKDRIVSVADVLVALPGGIGTLDEVFHTFGGSTLEYHSKQVLFLDLDGFYTPLLEYLSALEEQHFVRPSFKKHYQVARTVEELIALLD